MAFHSKLSPSSSSRWMHCAGSVEANAAGRRSSFYAEEGTAAAALLEISLRLDAEPLDFIGTFIHKDFKVTEEMAEAVGLALDYIRAYLSKHPNAAWHMEKKVDPASLLKCQPDYTSGTADVIIDNAPVELVVVDYKHGAGVLVEAQGNTQMLQYTLGYMAQYATRQYARYRQVIIQPRGRHVNGPVREDVLTHAEITAHAAKVKKRIIEIHKDPHHREAGAWCKFCAAQGTCKALAKMSMQAAAMEFGDISMAKKPIGPDELDPEELAYALNAWNTYIESWGKALYAAALEFMLRGGELPNHKLVYGRSTRSWSDPRAVARLLRDTFHFSVDDIAPREMIGIGSAEKLFRNRVTVRGRKKDPLPPAVKLLTQRSQPALHVAHANDPRKPVKRGEEFSSMEAEELI
jgi:Protein of unknown function (DUF2800)